jgi:DNA-binding Lrp family transcriptional regulator
MKLTDAQKNVLGSLELDAEKVLNLVARETKMKHSNVQRILSDLVARGVIDGKTAVIDLAKLGLVEYAFILAVNLKSNHELEEVVTYLLKHPAVSWIAEVGGVYDLMFNVVARHPKEVVSFFDRLSKAFPGLIKSKVSYIRTERLRYWRGYLGAKSHRTPGFHLGKAQNLIQIDDRDRLILKALANLKHHSFRELAHSVGLPIATFLRRMRALEQQEIILGFGYRIDLDLLELEQYRILISVTRDSEEWFRRLQNFCLKTGRVKLLTRTLGGFDFDLEVDVSNPRELKALLLDIRAQFPEASATTETLPIFRHRKFISFPAI